MDWIINLVWSLINLVVALSGLAIITGTAAIILYIVDRRERKKRHD